MNSPGLSLEILAFVLSLLTGVVFSVVESTVLMLNRLRLLALFGDEEEEESGGEQEILRETKDFYYFSRVGLCVALVAAALALLQIALAVLQRTLFHDAPPPTPHTPVLLAAAITLIVLPPVYAIVVYGLPRRLLRPVTVDCEDELPALVRVLVRIVRPVARFVRIADLLPFRSLLPSHQLSKSDLVAMVTNLDRDSEIENEEEEASLGGDTVPGANSSKDETPEPDDERVDEKEIVYNILDLESTLVREVMRPINSVVAVRLGNGMTVHSLRDLSRRTGYSRFPVYRDRIIDLIGYISIYDVLYSDAPDRPLEEYVTSACFVPEFARVSDLLQQFLKRGLHVAIVVDEYGGSSGWVTREDVLEEIVGEIEDEFDARRLLLHAREDKSYLADGAIDVDDLAEELPLHFDDPPYDTLGGFILMTLGVIPSVGDQVTTDEAVFTVEAMENNRITQVRIVLIEIPSENEPEPNTTDSDTD